MIASCLKSVRERHADSPLGERFRVVDVRPLPMLAGCGAVARIVRDVALRHGLAPQDVLSDRRQAALVAARHEAMYLARQRTPHDFTTLGRLFRKDRVTVIHGVRRHAERHGLPLPGRVGEAARS